MIKRGCCLMYLKILPVIKKSGHLGSQHFKVLKINPNQVIPNCKNLHKTKR